MFLAIFDSFSALSVWYGGGIAASNAVLQARCLRRDALAPEREALWRRLEASSFLTDDEKRRAVGYGALNGAADDDDA